MYHINSLSSPNHLKGCQNRIYWNLFLGKHQKLQKAKQAAGVNRTRNKQIRAKKSFFTKL